MATVGIAIMKSTSVDTFGHSAPVPHSRPYASEAITSSASSQASSNSVPSGANRQYFWEITASGGAVWVTFAAAPTAVVGTSYLVPDGGIRQFGAVAGDKVAVINA